MNIMIKSAVAAALSASVLAGCSSSSSSTSSFTAYTRVADLAAQTATISIADPGGTPVATITSQPADIALTVSATGVSATNVTFSLTATNNTPRILFGAKAVVNTISDVDLTAAPTSAGTGTNFDGDTFASFGFAAIDIDATANTTDDISITDADGLDDPLVITVTLPTKEYVAYGSAGSTDYLEYQIQDINGDIEDSSLASFTNLIPDGGSVLDSVISPDGRYVYSGGRNTNFLMRLDTVTLRSTGVRLTDGDIGNVGALKMTSNAQYIYAAYSENTHRYSDSNYDSGVDIKSYVAKIELSSMTVLSRARLPVTSSLYYKSGVRGMAISGDDSTLAISAFTLQNSDDAGQIIIVDTTGDDDKMIVAPSPLSATQARLVALNNDGSTVYYGVATGSRDVLHVIDVATGEPSTLALTNTNNVSPTFLGFGPDGRLYFMRQTTTDALSIFDFSVSATEVAVVDTVGSACGMDFYKGGGLYFICEGGETSIWDITDDTQVQAASGGSGFNDHAYAVSPY